MKNRTSRGQIALSKINEICPLAIPNQISTISMYILSLVKIHLYLLKLSYGNENTGGPDGRTKVGRMDRHTDIQRETIIPGHYRVAGYKKCQIFIVYTLNSKVT